MVDDLTETEKAYLPLAALSFYYGYSPYIQYYPYNSPSAPQIPEIPRRPLSLLQSRSFEKVILHILSKAVLLQY